MEPRLIDMHCHLNRVIDAEDTARELGELGVGVFCNTVEPGEVEPARDLFGGMRHVRVGAGLHPWWAADGSAREGVAPTDGDIARIAASRLVGEVGLDFSRAHAGTASAQVEAFERIARACAGHPVSGRVVSIHAVRAADAVMDILERSGLIASATCIFHWFSGTSEELARARRLGCRFSVNERMLATRRGREYARIIPKDRLLLETDAPRELDTPLTAGEMAAELERTLDALVLIRGCNRDKLAAGILDASRELLRF